MIVGVFAALAIVATPAIAAIVTGNSMRADVQVQDPLVGLYDYTNPITVTWDTTAEYDAGSHSGTVADVITDTLTLEPTGPEGTGWEEVTGPLLDKAWWDVNWNTRLCVELDHTTGGASTVSEYPIRVPLDIQQLYADGYVQNLDDFRAVADDDATELPLWVDPDLSAVWIQVDVITAGTTSTPCVYYGWNQPGPPPASALHGPAAVFTYSTFKPVYFAVSERFGPEPAGPPATEVFPAQTSVVSYTAGNQVRRDGAATLSFTNAGDRAVFDNATVATSVFEVLGPISATPHNNGFDTLVPISWAGTEFVSPTNREYNRFSVYNPFGQAATVRIFNNGTDLYGPFIVNPGQSVTMAGNGAPPTDDIKGRARITSDVPVLVVHTAWNCTASGNCNNPGDTVNPNSPYDAYALYPTTTGPLVGVATGSSRTATISNTRIRVQSSNGQDQQWNVNTTATRSVGGAPDGGTAGSRSGQLITPIDRGAIPPQPIGTISLADSDGVEATSFLPTWELSHEYWIPTNGQYTAFACPNRDPSVPTSVPIQAGAYAVTCSGSNLIGWIKAPSNYSDGPTSVNHTVGAQGVRIVDSTPQDGSFGNYHQPFFAMYEDVFGDNSGDEANILGWKQGRQLTWPAPAATYTSEGLGPNCSPLPCTGEWTSEDIDSGAGTLVYGQLDFTIDVEPGVTDVRFQIATGPAPAPASFVGPDDDPLAFYTAADLPAIIDYASDGDRYLRVRAYLESSDPRKTPRVDLVAADHNLALYALPVNGSAAVAVPGTVGSTSTHYVLRVRSGSPLVAASQAHLIHQGGSNLANIVTASLGFEQTMAAGPTAQLSYAGAPPIPASGPLVAFDATAPHSVVLTENMAVPAAPVTELGTQWRLNVAGGTPMYVDGFFTVEIQP